MLREGDGVAAALRCPNVDPCAANNPSRAVILEHVSEQVHAPYYPNQTAIVIDDWKQPQLVP